MFKADGTMYFLPENADEYWLDGYTCNELFSNEMHIRFDFGCGKSDIKGLTIKFGECYPTKFSVVTDDGASVEFENSEQIFKTDTVFDNTAYIELVITEMAVPNNRVRIDYIQFGLGLEYDNEWILEASNKTRIAEEKEVRNANSAGTMLLLRVQLIEYHDKYMKLGEIPSYAYENFCEMYKAYHRLGGNGMVTKMMHEIEELHLKQKGE